MWRSTYEAFMQPVIGRYTGKVDIYAVNLSELGGCRVRIEDTKEGGREKSTGVRRYFSRNFTDSLTI